MKERGKNSTQTGMFSVVREEKMTDTVEEKIKDEGKRGVRCSVKCDRSGMLGSTLMWP